MKNVTKKKNRQIKAYKSIYYNKHKSVLILIFLNNKHNINVSILNSFQYK